MKKSQERNCISVMGIQTVEGEKATFAKFNLKDAKSGEYFGAIAFGGIADQLAKEITVGGIALTVRGEQGDSDRFKVYSFVIKRPTEEIVSEDINVRIAGSPEKLKDLQKRIREDNTKAGRVRVEWGDGYSWFPQAECVYSDGAWHHKLDYCILMLTPDYVNRKCFEFTQANGGLSKALDNKVFRQRYVEFLNNLVSEANGESNPVQPIEEPAEQTDEEEIL